MLYSTQHINNKYFVYFGFIILNKPSIGKKKSNDSLKQVHICVTLLNANVMLVNFVEYNINYLEK